MLSSTERNFSLRHHVQTYSGAYPVPYPMGTGEVPRGQSDRNVELITYLHLLPRLIMRGATSTLTHTSSRRAD